MDANSSVAIADHHSAAQSRREPWNAHSTYIADIRISLRLRVQAVISGRCGGNTHRAMKFFLVTVFLFVASAVAQNIRIDSPSPGQRLIAGQSFTAKLTQTVTSPTCRVCKNSMTDNQEFCSHRAALSPKRSAGRDRDRSQALPNCRALPSGALSWEHSLSGTVQPEDQRWRVLPKYHLDRSRW